MFKVGDIVVGKKLDHPVYGLTNHEAVMEVINTTAHGSNRMRVKILVAPPRREDQVGKDYPVAKRHFELYIPAQDKVIVRSTDYMDCDDLSDEDKEIIGAALCLQ